MTWLITGGAGYIGAHIVRAFREAGRSVAVLDDLSSGFRDAVPEDVACHEAQVQDPIAVEAVLDAHEDLVGVIHLAGSKYAGESVRRPLDFYATNVEGTRVLLDAMAARGLEHLVFSSSCAVYGTPEEETVDEQAPLGPESPYGESKLAAEWLIRSQQVARPTLRHTSLRYFNVVGSGDGAPDAGAGEDGEEAEAVTGLLSPTAAVGRVADHSPYNLFPLVLRAIAEGRRPQVFGDDYPTPDGTCVRDYVHVVDLAEAHLCAAERLEAGEPTAPVYNVGRGEGLSVRQIVEAIQAVAGGEGHDVQPRRPGDPARIVGDAGRLAADFGWRPELGLDAMVASAWAAWQDPAAQRREAAQAAARV